MIEILVVTINQAQSSLQEISEDHYLKIKWWVLHVAEISSDIYC